MILWWFSYFSICQNFNLRSMFNIFSKTFNVFIKLSQYSRSHLFITSHYLIYLVWEMVQVTALYFIFCSQFKKFNSPLSWFCWLVGFVDWPWWLWEFTASEILNNHSEVDLTWNLTGCVLEGRWKNTCTESSWKSTKAYARKESNERFDFKLLGARHGGWRGFRWQPGCY